ncbi:MAG: hypothetical protein ACK55Z_09885, partial [bacterium]
MRGFVQVAGEFEALRGGRGIGSDRIRRVRSGRRGCGFFEPALLDEGVPTRGGAGFAVDFRVGRAFGDFNCAVRAHERLGVAAAGAGG